jgi:membrane fusion protein (multidrug efflux system)
MMCRSTLLLLTSLIACGGGHEGRRGDFQDKKKEATFNDWRVLVEATEVTIGSVANELVTHGSLESEAMADITPEAGGVVTEILVEEGDSISQGQVLAVLSNPSLEAGNDRAQVELSQARRRFEQAKQLHAQGAISNTEFLEAQDGFDIAAASYREASRSRGFTQLTSPIDGTVAIRDVRIGELASGAGRAFQVVDLSRLRVIVNLSERDLSHLTVGQQVSLAGAYDEEARADGTVLRISPVVDEATGTVRVTIAVTTDENGKLRPGQFVEVRIEVDRHTDVMIIPRKAVRWQDGSPIGWRIIDRKEDKNDDDDEREDKDEGNFFTSFFDDKDEDHEEEEDPWAGVPRRVVERVNLNLGYTDAGLAEVTSGLEQGDLIIVVGGDNLRPDAEVKLPGDPKPKKPKKKDEDEGLASPSEGGDKG